MIEIIISFIFGLLCSGLIYIFEYKKNVIGNLVIDESDPDGPYLFMEITNCKSVEELKTKKTIRMQVILKNYISQK